MKNHLSKYEDDYKWLKNKKEVDNFHKKYFDSETLSLSLEYLKKLANGQYLAWTFREDEYSHVLFLDNDVINVLKGLF